MFIEQGRRLPRFYGVSYLHFDRMGAEAHLIPFNLIIGTGHAVWLFVKAKAMVSLALWAQKFEQKK